MKLYTKTGDAGETGLFGGARVSKSDLRVEAYGSIDELNSVLGLARQHPFDADAGAALERIQSELFNLGAELATAADKQHKLTLPRVGDAEVERLEAAIDSADAQLPQLSSFVLPGGSAAAAALHHARTVCRRAERRIVALAAKSPVRDEILRYVNRLSDLLFAWARLANLRANYQDVAWKGRD